MLLLLRLCLVCSTPLCCNAEAACCPRRSRLVVEFSVLFLLLFWRDNFFGFSPYLPEKCFVLCNFELHSTAWRRVHRRLWNRPCSCLRPFPFAAATFPQRSKHKNKGSSCSQPSDRMRKGRKRLRTSVSQSGTFETSWAFSFYSISPSPLTHIVTHFFRRKKNLSSFIPGLRSFSQFPFARMSK